MFKAVVSILFAVVVVSIALTYRGTYRNWCSSQAEKTVAVMSGRATAPDAVTPQDELELNAMIEKTRETSDEIDHAFAEGDVVGGIGVLLESENAFYRDGSYSKNVAINAKELGGDRIELIDEIKTSDWMVSVAMDTVLCYAYWCIALTATCVLVQVTGKHVAVKAIETLIVLVGLAIPLMTAAAGLVLSGQWGLVATIFCTSTGLIGGLFAIIIPIGIALGDEEGDEEESA